MRQMPAQAREVRAWLGPAYDEMTPEQIKAFTQMIDTGDDEAVWVAAYETVAGTLDLHTLMVADTQAHVAASEARDRLRQGVAVAVAAGMSESEAARQVGVTRMTIRAWLGK